MAYANSRSAIIARALEMIQKQGDSTHQDRCKIWIADRARQLYLRHPWDCIRTEQSLTITAATSEYPLSKSMYKVFDILNENNVPLRQSSYADLDQAKGIATSAGNTFDADPLMYELRIKPIHTANPGTGSYTVYGAAGDTAVITVVGLVSGVVTTETATLSGVTPQTLTTAFTSLISVNKNADTTGDVIVKRGATEISRIYLGEAQARYLWVNFFFTPAASNTFTVIGTVNPPPFDDDNEIILIPDVGPYLTKLLLIDVYREDGQVDKSKQMEFEAWNEIDSFFESANPRTTKFEPPKYRKFG